MMFTHLQRLVCALSIVILNTGLAAPPHPSPSPSPSPKPSIPKPGLPPYLSAGTQWGVMSPTPWVNQQAAHWLKQKGTVWDGALAALSELLVKEPRIVSFHSDMALMTTHKGTSPQFIWLGHTQPVNTTSENVFATSSWASFVVTAHQKHSKYPLEQITHLAQKQASSPLAQTLKTLFQQKPLNSTQTPTSHTLPIAGTHLYALEPLFLGSLQTALDVVWPHKNLDNPALETTLQKTKFPALTTAYTTTWGMVLFDRYGSVLALNLGIPHIQTAKSHPHTHTLFPTNLSNTQSRQWSLTPIAAVQKNQLQFVVITHSPQPTAFLKSFPLTLFRYLKLNHSLIETLDKPPTLSPLSGFEVWPTTVVGFTPITGKTKPLME